MRRRQLKRLWARLKQLSTMQLTREELLMKLGAARDQSRIAWRTDSATFSYRLDRYKLRQARSREGRYLLRTNLVEEDPANADSGGSRPRIRDDVAHHSDLISLGVPR
jgi:hypothetical protein